MKRITKSFALSTLLVAAMSGCAHNGGSAPDSDNAAISPRTKKVLIAVGTALVIGAIAVNQTERSTRDAIRNAIPPGN